MTEQTAGIGHNNPPDINEVMAQEQRELYADKIKEIERQLAKKNELPTEINDDDAAGAVGDFFKLTKTLLGEVEKTRLAEKKKITVRSDAIHNFWKKTVEPLEAALLYADELRKPYIEKKEDEKRRKAAEEAAEKQRIADEKAAAAEEAARVAREKQEAAEAETRRIREEAEAKDKAAKEAADKIRRDAEAEAARIKKENDDKAAAAQAEIDKLKKEAADKILEDQKAEDERNAKIKQAEEDKKAADKLSKQADRDSKTVIAEAEKEAKAVEKEGREEVRAAEESVKELNRDVKDAVRTANSTLDQAARADRTASKAEKATLASSADFSRTRGFGSVQSISEKWVGEVAQRHELDLEALRDHIPFDALNRAVQSWVDANQSNRTLRGAHIFQDSKVVTR